MYYIVMTKWLITLKQTGRCCFHSFHNHFDTEKPLDDEHSEWENNRSPATIWRPSFSNWWAAWTRSSYFCEKKGLNSNRTFQINGSNEETRWRQAFIEGHCACFLPQFRSINLIDGRRLNGLLTAIKTKMNL